MKKPSFLNKFVLIAGLLFASQVFAVENWEDFAVEPQIEQIGGVDYRVIYTAEELAWVAKYTDHPGSDGEGSPNVKLMHDIDLGGKLWTPICAGKGTPSYNAIFDGNGFSVNNLYIKGSELLEIHDNNTLYVQNIGFIGVLGSGKVKNLILNDVNILATNDDGINPGTNEISVGGLVGWKNESSAGSIENVVVSGTITVSGKGQGIGGIVGNARAGSIKNSVSTVDVYANGNKSYIGGIIGLTKANFNVESCVYAGEKLVNTGTGGSVGAIVGDHRSGTLTTTNTFYDSDLFETGVGMGTATTTNPTSELNSEAVVCVLNKGTIDENGDCDKQEPWSVGSTTISLNGSDGYKVVFDANGGAFPVSAKTFKLLSSGNAITADEISEPSKEGFSFAGWSLEADASEPSSLGTATKATRVYAVWYPLMTVTFDATDGYFPPESPVVKTKTKTIAIDEPLTVEGLGSLPESFCSVYSQETGCDEMKFFAGWSFDKNATAEQTVDLNELNTFVTRDTTLYAIWTTEEIYTVTFHAVGHGKTKVAFVKVKSGDKVEKMDAVPDEGYIFEDWFTEDGVAFDFDKTGISRSIILYAHWIPEEYTIHYELNGGVNASSNHTKYTVETPTFKFANPSNEGYTFVKWCYDAECSEPASQITQGTTGDKTLYTQWEIKSYTITYLSGKSVIGTTIADKKNYGESITLKGEVETFKRSGYTQDGWSTEDGGKRVYSLGGTYTANEDITLYPHWVEGNVEVSCYGAVTVYTYTDGHKEAVIDGNSIESTNIPEDIENVASVRFDRTFPVGNRSTIVLPFDIAVANTHGGKFNVLSSISGDFKTITLGEKTSQLYAYEPYVMLADEPTLTFDGPVTLKKTIDGEKQIGTSDWYFVPAYEKIVFGERDDLLGRAYGFAGKAVDDFSVGQFVKAGKYAWVGPMKAYLVYRGELNGSSATKSAVGSGFGTVLPDEINVVVQGEQGNIVERGVLDTKTGEFRMDSWYDLQGRKLNCKPQTQGTYYHNGSRVIVK